MLGRIMSGARLIGMALLITSGCGGPPGEVIIGTARAPSADGLIDAEESGSYGSTVTVHMERLPAPAQLGEGLKYYLVWFEEKNGKPIFAGPLAYQPEARTGDLKRSCPFREFRLRITAERSQKVAVPSDLTIAERAVTAE
jgi:hypothetical protein